MGKDIERSREFVYKPLGLSEITPALFLPFNRYQKVTQCWRFRNGQWQLEDICFIEDWREGQKEFLVTCLQNTVQSGGAVLAAMGKQAGNAPLLAGFASVENQFFGAENQYLQLSSLHVSFPCRGKGIGARLFLQAAGHAKLKKAQKLYISAHSAKETYSFYKKMGCTFAKEVNPALAGAEPCDCQLELDLSCF